MKLAIVSSWNERCGISEYTRVLVSKLSQHIPITVIANFNVSGISSYVENDVKSENHSNVERNSIYVKEMFHVPFLDNVKYSDIEKLESELCQYDIVHVQFETALYHPSWFPELIKRIHGKVKLVFTMHSHGVWGGFNLGLVDAIISHQPISGTNTHHLSMPVEFFETENPQSYNSLTSFGLARNDDRIALEAIKDTNISYSPTYGTKRWLSRPELVKEISKSWMICLLYPPVGANVSSSASMLAIGCNRPLFITDTNWFSTIKNLPGVYIIKNSKDLKDYIIEMCKESNLSSIKEEIAEREQIILNEGRDLDGFVLRHLEIYKKLAR